jgi:guanylate kinase
MKNELRHLEEFQEILTNYKISENLRNELQQSKLVLLTAPTGIGRNTLIRELIKSGQYHFMVSDTTRHPRHNDGVLETNGKEYWFKTEDEFLEGLKEGRYIEAAIIHKQQVSGINVSEIIKANTESQIAITDAEIKGAETLFKVKPDTIAIFVLPPTFEEWMKRLKNRGEMSQAEFKRRLASAIAEFDFYS